MNRAGRITAGGIGLAAVLNDSPTARAVLESLPIAATGNRLGEEICFEYLRCASKEPEERAMNRRLATA